ncbi:MAG: carboxypeptidase regulatory-like domain-containing protein [Bacteroidales bacterium]|nr:carboxypeptidase regulatory-like domain-containing protein [Bacteroidales bacterium]
MKQRRIALIGLLIFSIVSLCMFSSCDKDTDCKLKVFVVKKNDGRAVAKARVEVGKQGGTIGAEGETDVSGVFQATFAAPAIFDVTATYAVYGDDGSYIGNYANSTSVRLKDGEEVSVTIELDYSNLQQ